jgi:hypothetical protein
MNTIESVTKFVIRRDHWYTPFGTFGYKGEAVERCKKADMGENVIAHSIEMADIKALIKALNAHLKAAKTEAEEYDFSDVSDAIVPEKYRWLIAFAVEGSSEGYYVHIGAILPAPVAGHDTHYMEFGLAKTYSAESAYAIAREAQRFLTAAQWN